MHLLVFSSFLGGVPCWCGLLGAVRMISRWNSTREEPGTEITCRKKSILSCLLIPADFLCCGCVVWLIKGIGGVLVNSRGIDLSNVSA